MGGKVQQRAGLSGNQLKLIAMAAMTCDHVGLYLLPQLPLLRILGRLALPIYAYMIAEGCRYTHDRGRYLGRLALLALVCQVVYFFAMGSLYQCILVTFSLSVVLIWGLERAGEGGPGEKLLAAAGVLGVWFLCEILPRALPAGDFAIDYGFFGVLLPVLVYFGRDKRKKLALLTLGLCLLGIACGGVQWWALAAVPLMACYSGRRGSWRMGSLFYLYYPAHLVVIYLAGMLTG